MKLNALNDLTRFDVAVMLDELINRRGFALPIHIVAIGANGSLFAGTFNPSVGLTPTAEHFVDDIFKAPLNVIFVDSDGEAARAVIGPDGEKRWAN
jgi:hypothetical protein